MRAVSLFVPLALVAWAFHGVLGFEHVADARFLIADNNLLDLPHLWDNLTHDYFWSSSGASIPYWRPVTKGSWVIEAALFGRGPAGFFAVQLAWLLAAVAGIWALARRMDADPIWAGAAAVVFGLHASMVEPGCLVMARSDLVCVAAGLWSVWAWLGWRESGGAGRALVLVHVFALVVALGSKETAIVLPAVLTAWALLDPPRRLGHVLPAWCVAALYLIARRVVLGDVGSPSVVVDPARLLGGGGVALRGLLPGFASPVHNLPLAEASWIGGALAWSVLGVLFWLGRRERPLILMAAAWIAPVLLVEQVHVPGAEEMVPLADRWIIGGTAALAVAGALAAGRAAPFVRRTLLALVAMWSAAMVWLAPYLHAPYRDELALLDLEDRRFEETPPERRTRGELCRAAQRVLVRAAARSEWAKLIAESDALPADCRRDRVVRFNRLAALVGSRNFAAAVVEGDALAADPALDRRFRAAVLHLGGVAHLATGDPEGAVRRLRAAIAAGLDRCAVDDALVAALVALGRTDEAAAARCR